MVLKKQTVWLLTMLSLIIVLSVYYVQTPAGPEEVAFVGEEEDLDQVQNQVQDQGETEIREIAEDDATVVNVAEEFEEIDAEETDNGIISSISTNDVFTEIRMNIQASRDRLAEEFTQVRASSESTAEMISEAHDKIQELHQLSQKEEQLETLIIAKGFEDALVMTDDENVRVIVQADELSPAEANEIFTMTREHLDRGLEVAIEHAPTR